MPEWKKVIVSGSNGELNQVTASLILWRWFRINKCTWGFDKYRIIHKWYRNYCINIRYGLNI